MRISLGAAFAVAALLAGCASTTNLYPENDIALKCGPLKGTLMKYGVGSGPISITMPDGEVLTGQYTMNLGGAVGFGSTYGGGRSTFSTASVTPMGSTIEADLSGPKGTTMRCELRNNNLTARGNGECRASNGAAYRVQY
jgi:hypothetical protein